MREPCQRIGQAHQNQRRIWMLFQKLRAGWQRDLRAMVASHTVNSDCDHGVGAQKEKRSNIGHGAKNDKSPTLQDL